jgi:hypothetical protein
MDSKKKKKKQAKLTVCHAKMTHTQVGTGDAPNLHDDARYTTKGTWKTT